MDSPQSYPRRPGSDDVGRDYEIKMTALLALRCATMEDTQDMWLGSNVEQVGDFDDIVLSIRSQNKRTSYLMQLKHQESPKNITQREFTFSKQKKKVKKAKEDFSLAKYYASFLELKRRLETPEENELEIIKSLRESHKVALVLYTNRGINECEFLERGGDTCDFLSTCDKACIYALKQNKFSYDPTFIEQFVLFTNQIHVNEVDTAIKNEIKKLVGASKTDNLHYKKIANDFVLFIKAWIKGAEPSKDNSLKLCCALTKFHVIGKLINLLLDAFKVDFSKESYTLYDCALKITWNEIICDKSVTIVDTSDEVLRFLKAFIGSEVKKHWEESKETWGDHLSKRTECLKHNSFADAFKLFDKCEEVTLFTIYQCLWHSKKLPLLVSADNKDAFENIIKILKLSSHGHQVIIMTSTEIAFKKIRGFTYLHSLRDLEETHRKKILDCHVYVQARASVKLGNILDKSMYDHIKSKEIIQVLSGTFNIGQEYEALPKHLIETKLCRTFLKPKVLTELKDEVFLLENKSDCDVDLPNVVDFDAEEIEELKYAYKTLHRVVLYDDNWLEWKESLGDVKNMKRYELIKKGNLYKEAVSQKVWESLRPLDVDLCWEEIGSAITGDACLNTVRVFSANPGAGKTTLMDFIASQAPADIWVLKIILNEHDDYFEKMGNDSIVTHLKYFNNETLSKYNCCNLELSQVIFDKLLKTKKLIVLLDGFDEVFFSYENEVVKLLDLLMKENYRTFVTTRPHLQSYLEEQFCTIATTLKPFTECNQKQFLVNYFKDATLDSELIDSFAEKLLKAAKCNLSDDKELMGVPLQLKLLADVFADDLTMPLQFNDQFNLLHIYEEFLRKKADILCAKFGKGAKEMRIMFDKVQQKCALKISLPKHVMVKLNIDEHAYDKDQMFFLQREGVVTAENNDIFRVKFVHSTFAWYFVAKWFFEHLPARGNVLSTLDNLFKIPYYDFMFRMFHFMVAKNDVLHTMILTSQVEEAQQLIKDNPDSVDKTDLIGRSCLHLISLCGLNHDDYEDEDSNIVVNDKMLEVIQNIPSDRIKNVKDDLGYTPLDYAVQKNAMAVANVFSKSTPANLNVIVNGDISFFGYCFTMGYKSLFSKVLLPYFAYRSLLYGDVNQDESIAEYCSNLSHVEGFCSFIKELEITNLLELFQYQSTHSPTIHTNYFRDLHIAVAFGTEDNINSLLNNQDLNKSDSFGNSLLHYASLHGRSEIVELLMSKGAKTNVTNSHGDTPVHFAASKGHVDVLKTLSDDVNINVQNNSGDSAFFQALKNGHIGAANFLLEKHDVNIENESEKSTLHYAAEAGADEIVRHLASKGADVNKRSNTEETPLLLALGNKHVGTAKLLLSFGADASAADKFSESPLHYLASIGDEDLITNIISKGAPINKTNYKGETPLLLALKAHNISVAKLLLAKGAAIDGPILHYASEIGDEDVVLHLLTRGAHINQINDTGETPLLCALKHKKINIAKLLLAKGAVVASPSSHVDYCCPLLYAVTVGLNDIIPDLLSQGADINKSNLFGETPLLLALKQGHADTARLLCSCGANIDVANLYKQGPLYYSIRFALLRNEADVERQCKFVSFLIENSADVNIQDWEGYAPLHAISGRCEVFQDNYETDCDALYQTFARDVIFLLLSKGADVCLKNKDGETALDLAVYYENDAVISLLKEL